MIKQLAKIINALPEAFNKAYWNMADTTFKEEIIISSVEEKIISKQDAYKLLRLCKLYKSDSPIVYAWLDGDVDYGMGVFTGITEKGTKIMKTFNGY